jgi:hypothetical protein
VHVTGARVTTGIQLSEQSYCHALQIPTPEHGDFQAVADAYVQRALQTVCGSAQRVAMRATVTGTAAFEGCVHLLLEVTLEGGPAAAPGTTSVVPLEAPACEFSHALVAAIQEQDALASGMPVAATVVPLGIASAAAIGPGGVDEAMWNELPLAALVSPVCVAGSDGDCHILLGLLPGASQQLPAQPKVVASYSSWNGSKGMQCSTHVLAGDRVWVPAAGTAGRSRLGLRLPPVPAVPAVATLHVLPGPEEEAGAGAAGRAAHPVASLSLLCLPAAAAEEVLQLWAVMLQELSEQAEQAAAADSGSTAALDGAATARKAYWCHLLPFVHCWAGLLAAAEAARTGQQDSGITAACATDIACLLVFMEERGMRACLDAARDIVRSSGLGACLVGVLKDQKAVLQKLQLEQAAGSSSGSSGPQAAAAGIGAQASAGSSDKQAPDKLDSRQSLAVAEQQAVTKLLADAEEAVTLLRPAAAHALVPALTWRQVLLGFRDPAAEASYLAFKNQMCQETVDYLAALLAPCIIVAWLVALWQQGPPAGTSSHQLALDAVAMLLYNLPWLALLLSRGWYLRHRERLLVWCAGAGRAVLAGRHGVLPLVLHAGVCTGVHRCQYLVMFNTVMFPVLQPVRLLPSALLTAVDALGGGLLVAQSGPLLLGWLAWAGSAATGVALAAGAERRSRMAFLSAGGGRWAE